MVHDRFPPASRVVRVLALVALGVLACGVAVLVDRRWSAPIESPRVRAVDFDVVVVDSSTGLAVAGAEVGFDQESGDFDDPGPSWAGATDSGGQLRVVGYFAAVAVPDGRGGFRGTVVFHDGVPPSSVPDLLVVRAPGYRGATIDLDARFPRGIAFEDRSARTIRVPLAPGFPR